MGVSSSEAALNPTAVSIQVGEGSFATGGASLSTGSGEQLMSTAMVPMHASMVPVPRSSNALARSDVFDAAARPRLAGPPLRRGVGMGFAEWAARTPPQAERAVVVEGGNPTPPDSLPLSRVDVLLNSAEVGSRRADELKDAVKEARRTYVWLRDDHPNWYATMSTGVADEATRRDLVVEGLAKMGAGYISNARRSVNRYEKFIDAHRSLVEGGWAYPRR